MRPYAIYVKGELRYLGLHASEADCWTVAKGWPSNNEIEQYKRAGEICLPVRVVALGKEQSNG